MRQRLFWLSIVLTLGVGGLLAAGMSTKASGEKDRETPGKPQGPLTVTVTPVGPTQAAIDAAVRGVQAHPTVSKYLNGNRIRRLSFDQLEPQPKSLQERFRVAFFDYTNNRSILVDGVFGDPRQAIITIGSVQPLPSPEEFDAAVEILKTDPTFGELLRAGKAKTYRPMPPLVSENPADQRALTVGLLNPVQDPPNQIVGVNLITGELTTFRAGAPPASLATPEACGVPGAGQPTTTRGTAGQYNVVVYESGQGGVEIWRMLTVRPAASSGTRASGIELRDVYYRGKLVFKRAHVPILNVQYNRNLCGPYRDWQWQEGMFQVDGTDVAPGFRVAQTPPETVMENGTDLGNFRGVAVYQTSSEVLLLSELEAGWYRYISRWEFTTDGVIRARFGFDGVNNSCVCNTHYHHAYFRFDFDLATAGRNQFTEYDTFAFNTPIMTEAKRYRDYLRDRYWTIENIVSGELIRIDPGHDDGVADTYGRGDAWFLRSHSTELDDGVNTTGPNNTEANLDQFVNGESLDGQDVVMWYGGHFVHNDGNRVSHPEDDGHPHLVGPNLVVVRW